jgi:hypothetical protein
MRKNCLLSISAGGWIRTVFAGVLVLVLLAAWLATRREGQLQSPPRHERTAVAESLGAGQPPEGFSEVEIKSSQSGSPSSKNAAVADARRTASTSSLQVAIVDEAGNGVSGLTVSQTPLRPAFLQPWVGWSQQDWDEVRSATRPMEFDSVGKLTLPSQEDSTERPAVIWITHPKYLPEAIHLGMLGNVEETVSIVKLRTGPEVTVTVRDSLGALQEGIVVQQLAPIPNDGRANDTDPPGLRVLLREVATDSHGMAQLASWSGPMLLRAKGKGMASKPWVGEPRRAIALEITNTFTAHGEVSFIGELEGTQRVTCLAEQGPIKHVLETDSVRDGKWGPLELPLLSVEQYVFRMEGWHAEVSEVRIDPPAPGSIQQIDFTTRAGNDMGFVVEDQAKNKVATAIAEVEWQTEGIRTTATATAAGRKDGCIIVRGVPPGVVRYTISAPGYAAISDGPFAVPSEFPFAVLVVLSKAGYLSGRVLHQGEPVRDFEITTWAEPGSRNAQTTSFSNCEDGSFALDSVPLGTVGVVAQAPNRLSSRVQMLQIDGQPTELVLDLEQGRRGFGSVVDGVSVQPIPGAVLQPYIAGNYGALKPTTAPIVISPSGRFDLNIFSAGKGRVKFWAPGYSARWVDTLARADEDIDFGLIGLVPTQALTVTITGSHAFDPTRYSFSMSGVDTIPEVRFDSGGKSRIEGISAGVYDLILSEHDGPQYATVLQTRLILAPGEVWNVEFLVDGDRKLSVDIKNFDLTSGSFQVEAELPRPGGRPVIRLREVPPSGHVEFRGLNAGTFQVLLTENSSRAVVGRVAGAIDDSANDVEVVLTPSRHRFTFRVVDGLRLPVPGAQLFLVSKNNASDFTAEYTDEQGKCVFRTIGPGEYRGMIRHPDRGAAVDTPVVLSDDDSNPVELLFDPQFVVAVQLMDGDVPLSGVNSLLWDAAKLHGFPAATSDSAGIVTWSYFTKAMFQVHVNQGGCWPTHALVESGPPEQPTVMQVRRRGSLEFEVRNAQGLAVSDQVIDLKSVEFETDVAEWLEQKKVKSAQGGLQTDKSGRLRIDGLPRGDHVWSIDAGSGVVLEGLVSIPPNDLRKLPVYLP